MEVGVYKDIVSKLTEAMEQLTNNNASLTVQLSDYMKINIYMDNNLNLKAAQVQDPEGKILVDKANRKDAFERNLDPTGY